MTTTAPQPTDHDTPDTARRIRHHVDLHDTAVAGVRALIELAGYDPDAPGLSATPTRVVRSLLAAATVPTATVAEVLGPLHPVTPHGIEPGPILVGPLPFASTCEHHLLPFTGTAHIAYRPDGHEVIGLSKFARLLAHYALRLQIQERLTNQVAAAVYEHAHPAGVAVTITGSHTCMTARGTRSPGGLTTTAHLGSFHTGPDRDWFERRTTA